MDTARFWTLVDLLHGVADDASVARLEAELADEEVDAFLEAVHERVETLLQRCRVPDSHTGDDAECLAAAVVAAGRTVYETTRAAGGTLDPQAWRWQDAEALLVAGVLVEGGEDDDDLPHSPFVLQWLTERLPAGVTSAWTPVELVLPEGIDPDDPGLGHVPATDPAWDAAREALAEDPAVAGARQEVGARFGATWDAVGVWLVLRDDAEEPEITVWPSDGEGEDDGEVVIVGALAADDLRDLDGAGRTAAYVELVTGLLQVVLEDS